MKRKHLTFIICILMVMTLCSACANMAADGDILPNANATPVPAPKQTEDETAQTAAPESMAPETADNGETQTPYKDSFEWMDINYDYNGFDVAADAMTLGGEAFHAQTAFEEAKLTVLTAWTTTCPACIMTMPVWGELAEEYKGSGVEFVGVCADAADEETIETAKQIILDQGIKYPQLIVNDEVQEKIVFNMMYLPTTFFVDSTGKTICAEAIGYMTKDKWVGFIETIMAEME